MTVRLREITVAFVVLFFVVFEVRFLWADEGMWLFSNPPKAEIQKRYGFTPSDGFLEHLQKSSVRFSNGGSASFVSPDGLVMTNHHVAFSSLGKLSNQEHHYVDDGFYAVRLEDELPCADLELVVLQSMEDVTGRVTKAENRAGSPEEKTAARKNVIAQIERESLEKTGFFSEVMSFYRGGRYHLYRYKKFTDVRLVFAPEENVGFFGGEPDNFEYPRWNLDVAFFRVYEDGKPYRSDHYLRWSPNGAADGELVFVSGHPGRTDRLDSVAHLEFLRDVYYPFLLNRVRRQEVLLQMFSEKSEDRARRVSSELFRLRNTRKNRAGILLGLQTPEMMAKKRDEETSLRVAAARQRLFTPGADDPWREEKAALDQWRQTMIPFEFLETGQAFNSQLFDIARRIVRLTEESTKPDDGRLPEYRESAIPTMKTRLMSPTPIDVEIETLKLADSLGMYLDFLGNEERGDEKFPGWNFLDGKSPRDRAVELVRGTKLTDPAERQKLLDAGFEKVKKSDDPMIRLALACDGPARAIRQKQERLVDEPLKTTGTKIAKIRFAVLGDSQYPDATFTLRLSYGKVAGYTDRNSVAIPPWTTIAGAFAHAEEHDFVYPFSLSKKWRENRGKIDESTPMNLVTTNDIVGGNSGSPLVNVRGEIVGLIFDGNVDSLPLNFIFTEETARAVSVHSAVIPEALRKIYGADRLVDEIFPPASSEKGKSPTEESP